MSTIPPRTRSLRKPAEAGSRHAASCATSVDAPTSSKSERSSQSPSRLPIKPTTRSTNAGRPPSASGSTLSTTSMRPPPSRANISAKSLSTGTQSSSSSQRSNAPSTTESDPVKKDRSRPPITISRHKCNTSTSSSSASVKEPSQARTRSSSTHSTVTSLRPPTRGTEESKGQVAQPEPQLRKPAFSTLQQHFSPAKSLAPKPHPAAFLAPPSPSKLPSNIAISAETAKLQNELLQVHLLHKGASRTEADWRASAKRKLGARFQSVVEENDRLVQLEIRETGRINAAALKAWQDLGVPGWGLEEKIQILDAIITGVWNLNESGGKYAKLVRRFERWVKKCQDIMDSRNNSEDEVVFLEDMDSAWKDDCLFLGRKLETWRDQLSDLGVPDCETSLGVVVNGTSQLVRGMLQELSYMGQIERDAMCIELEWIKSMNHDESDDGKDTPIAGAVWRLR